MAGRVCAGLCSPGRWGGGCLSSCPCSGACPVPFCSSPGSTGSSAEPGQLGQLRPAGQAETSQDTARATCVRHQAGPAGPPSYLGMALPLCLGGGLQRGGPAWCHSELWLSCLLWHPCHLKCSSEQCWPWPRRRGAGTCVLGFADSKCKNKTCRFASALWKTVGQTLTSFSVAQFPGDPCPRGTSWKVEGRGARCPLGTRPQALGWAPGGGTQTAGQPR